MLLLSSRTDVISCCVERPDEIASTAEAILKNPQTACARNVKIFVEQDEETSKKGKALLKESYHLQMQGPSLSSPP